MTCAGCAASIEKGLGKLEGVSEVSVSYATRSARVDTGLPEEQVLSAIAALGYEGVPSIEGQLGDHDGEHEARVATRAALQAMACAVGVLVFGGEPVIALILTTLALVFPARGMLVRALAQARHRSANMDTLVSLGVLAALGHALWSWATHGHVMLMAPAFIMGFVLVGKALEARARVHAGEAMRKLVAAVPRRARVWRDGRAQEIAAEEVAEGDVCLVHAGESVPVDGELVEGNSGFDESLLSGESMPVWKRVGDRVVAGSVNAGGEAVRLRATAVGGESTLASLLSQLAAAQSSKPPVQRLADRVSGVFVPVVVAIAALAWLVNGPLAAVAVLVIACPCALGLATPVAVQIGTGRAAQLGILVRDAAAFEAAGRLDLLLLDKTGTITRGEPVVEELRTVNVDVDDEPSASTDDANEALAAAVGLEARASHPLGRALKAELQRRGLHAAEVDELSVRPVDGGLLGRLTDGRKVTVGNAQLMHMESVPLDAGESTRTEFTRRGWSLVFVALDGELRLVIGVGDQIRPTSTRAVRILKGLDIEPVLCTGDHAAAAQAMATLAGITRVHAEQSPAEKAERVEELRAAGHKVGMVGDGSNDAPALAAADCGLAVGASTDLARAAAPLVLIDGDLARAATALELARATLRVIRQNLGLAFAYNLAALPLAFAGLVDPPFAAGAMALSSLAVVGNALRLRRFRPSLDTAFGLES
ncbi:MAG: carbonate dehydratase [Planctomycetota bacterium]|nr:MAG: carbonate dehydratase [Planctomycetota bacterium]